MQVFPAKLKTQEVIPAFELPSARGGTVGPRTYRRQRNLVLIVFHDGRCRVCRDLLAQLADQYEEFRALNAEVLAISTLSADDARAIANTLNLPFHLLYDSSGQVVDRFTYRDPKTGRPAPSIVVTDRFGAVYTTIQVDEDNPPQPEQILDWLRFIEIQCPE